MHKNQKLQYTIGFLDGEVVPFLILFNIFLWFTIQEKKKEAYEKQK